MNTETERAAAASGAPWHLWVVGVLALLWNGSGTVTILMAQMGMLANLSEEEAAYYAAQPLWLAILVDIALFTSIAAAIALLMRHRVAVTLFGVSLVAIFITDVWELVTGTGQMLASTGAMIVTALIFVIAVLELVYARAMKSRGVLS